MSSLTTRNKRPNEGPDELSESLDARKSKKQDLKLTPRDPATGDASTAARKTDIESLNSYQRAFLQKYGDIPPAEPTGGVKWNAKAGVTDLATGSSKSGKNAGSKTQARSRSKKRSDRKGSKVQGKPDIVAAAQAAAARSAAGSKSEGKTSVGGGRWSKEEDEQLRQAVKAVGAKNWRRISIEFLNGRRSDVQCLHRWQKVLRPGLVKGPWTKDEDIVIIQSISKGITKWSEIADLIPGRIGKQCRERWFNHLDPRIKKGPWSEDEDRILIEAQSKLGNRWCEIAKMLPGRSENSVKNRWNSAMRRKYQAKKASEDGSVPPPSPERRRYRKKSSKKAKKTTNGKATTTGKRGRKKGSKVSKASMPPPHQAGTLKPIQMKQRAADALLPPADPWIFDSNADRWVATEMSDKQGVSGPAGLPNDLMGAEVPLGVDPAASGETDHRKLLNGMFSRDPAAVQDFHSGSTGHNLSPMSRAFTKRAEEQQRAMNKSSLTNRERQLMHQAFLAGAAVSQKAAQPGGFDAIASMLQSGTGEVQWDFGNSLDTSDNSIPSISTFSELLNANSSGSGARRDMDTSRTSRSKDNLGAASWALGSMENAEMLNSAEMADMSLSLLGLSIENESTSNAGPSSSTTSGGKPSGSSASSNLVAGGVPHLSMPAPRASHISAAAVAHAQRQVGYVANGATEAEQGGKQAIMGLPLLSPTAAKLAEISGEFRLGNITAEEKERRKEDLLRALRPHK